MSENGKIGLSHFCRIGPWQVYNCKIGFRNV